MARSLAVAVVALLGLACSGSSRPAEPATLVVSTGDRELRLEVEVADTEEERSVGLSGREEIGRADGMAFVWEEPVEARFWMKDTLIPLSIAFWDEDGRIVGILDMDPCRSEPCPTYGPGRPYVGAVEVEQGLFETRGVELGDRVRLDGVDG